MRAQLRRRSGYAGFQKVPVFATPTKRRRTRGYHALPAALFPPRWGSNDSAEQTKIPKCVGNGSLVMSGWGLGLRGERSLLPAGRRVDALA